MQRTNKYVSLTKQVPKGQVIAHRVGTFSYTNMKAKTYIFPYNEKHMLCFDTTGTQVIDFLIGQYLVDCFQTEESITQGLQLVRLKVGSSTIVARKRFNDVKITIYEDAK